MTWPSRALADPPEDYHAALQDMPLYATEISGEVTETLDQFIRGLSTNHPSMENSLVDE